MSDEINTQYTKEIVCPYCFYKESESWDNLEDSSAEKVRKKFTCVGDITFNDCEKRSDYLVKEKSYSVMIIDRKDLRRIAFLVNLIREMKAGEK